MKKWSDPIAGITPTKNFIQFTKALSISLLWMGPGAFAKSPSPQVLPRIIAHQNTLAAKDTLKPVRLKGVNIADPQHIDLKRPGMSASQVILKAQKDLGANVIRVPLLPGPYKTEGFFADPESYLKEHVDPLVKAAADNHLYLILEPHFIGPYKPLKQNAMRFWSKVAPRYKNEPHVIFDIFNEPTYPNNWSHWKESVAQDLVDHIRSFANDTLLIIPGPYWSMNLKGVLDDPIDDGNVAYGVHIYPENIARNKWQHFADISKKYPVFVTEWGFDAQSEFPVRGDISSYGSPLQKWMDSHNLSWTVWVYDPVWMLSFVDKNWQVKHSNLGSFVQSHLKDSL